MTGHVFRADDGRLFMIRCPRCGRENYAGAVSSGTCAFCGEVAKRATSESLEVNPATENADWPKRDHLPSEVRDDD